MAESRMAISLPPVQPGWHSLTVDTHAHTLQAAVSDHGLLLYIPHPRFLFRSLIRSSLRLRNKFVTALYPLHPLVAMFLIVLTAAYVIVADRTSWVRSGWLAEFLWAVDEQIPFVSYFPLEYRLAYLSVFASVTILLVFVALQRLLLRLLLHYKGWIFDPPGKPSFITQVWATALTYMFIKRGQLLTFSFQHALPRLPVPPLKDTVEKYMRTVKPLLSEEKYAELEAKKNTFLKKQGPKLQKYLVLRSWITNNYISEWWLRFVYLRGRSSIYINSNYYAIPSDGFSPLLYPRDPITRAANLIYSWIVYKRKIDHEELRPIIAGVHPMCMQQYSLLFSTTRIPQREEDQLCHWDAADSRHIVVLYKGAYYRLAVYNKNGSILSPYQLYLLLGHIVDNRDKLKTPINNAEANVAALTTLDRGKWAEIREEFFSVGVNHYSLSQIERSIFVLAFDEHSPQNVEETAKLLFCGNGGNRWCDKSLNHIMFANGLSGYHVEHSWADAPVMAHSAELTTCTEIALKNWDENGKMIPPSKAEDADVSAIPAPQRLRFQMTDDLEAQILDALNTAQYAEQNLDLAVYKGAFGKSSAKKCRLSPDSFVQMALQLTYYRLNGYFALTYESAMMRFYQDGRTETIRSLSQESVDFVLAMDNEKVPKEEKIRLHRIAVEGHNHYAKEATCGRGVDRHLFALYVVAMGTETEAEFLQEALKIPWKLSTSQIPSRQHDGWPKDDNRGENELYMGVGGGFGPVADDGYGVCYMFVGENRCFFHISSKKSCATTDSSKFRTCLAGALTDILKLYE